MEMLEHDMETNVSIATEILKIISIVLAAISTIISVIIIDQKRKKAYKEFLDERDRQQRNFGKH